MPQKTRVMVVEDDRASRAAMLALLRLVGFEAVDASTVSDALKLLSANPSCLILDLMLPDGNGALVLEYIRRHRLPIRVAVTTGAPDWQALVGTEVQPDAIFPKPVDFQALSAWLTEAAVAG